MTLQNFSKGDLGTRILPRNRFNAADAVQLSSFLFY